MNDREYIQLSELLLKSIEGEISEEEFALLDRKLAADTEAARYYNGVISIYATLINEEARIQPAHSSLGESNNISRLLQVMAEDEKTAPAIEIEEPEPVKVPVKMVKVEKTPRVINKFSLYSPIISAAAAFIFIFVYVKMAPKAGSPVATIVDSINAQWELDEHYAENVLWDNEDFRWLKKGTVKIVFDYGAEAILEGPIEFKVDSPDEMALRSGRLYTMVPERATGFIVRTPCATVIDQGTEFGVKVDFDGSTNVHMFRGKAMLVPGSDGDKKKGQGLTAGQAKLVTQAGVIRDIDFQEQMFVRRIDSQKGFLLRGTSLDLADLINGGDGLGGGTSGSNIDLGTGQVELRRSGDIRYTDNRYHPCTKLPFVDGVFVPDGGSGSVQISSQGHQWTDCPDTTGQFVEGINTREITPTQFSNASAHEMQRYRTHEYPRINMSLNGGVTFDLKAIREAFPGVKIIRFEGACGITKVPSTKNYNADISILVDGKKRFEAKKKSFSLEPTKFAVDLRPDDRFLTLVSNESNLSAKWGNWSFFAKPRLILD